MQPRASFMKGTLKNKFADYVPSIAHFLTPVGLEAVKTELKIINFLGTVQ